MRSLQLSYWRCFILNLQVAIFMEGGGAFGSLVQDALICAGDDGAGQRYSMTRGEGVLGNVSLDPFIERFQFRAP